MNSGLAQRAAVNKKLCKLSTRATTVFVGFPDHHHSKGRSIVPVHNACQSHEQGQHVVNVSIHKVKCTDHNSGVRNSPVSCEKRPDYLVGYHRRAYP